MVKIRFMAFEDHLKSDSPYMRNIKFGYNDELLIEYVQKKKQGRTFLILDL